MRNVVDYLTGNRILNVSIIAFVLAQTLKVLISLVQNRKFDMSRLFGSGGMPSSHSATVCALTVSVGRVSGTHTAQFAISAVLAIIVMYDALNVRRQAGQHAKILNYIIENWHDMSPDLFQRKLKELLGHTPLQVVCGAILGIALGFLM
ncbi:MAG: divergent PAP2 family protein [Oscillospiraceae bacterium]|nr:divergent PAP2 family protein [Oscillospiraceae bacterium]